MFGWAAHDFNGFMGNEDITRPKRGMRLRMGKRLLATGTFPIRGLFKAFGNEDVPNPKPFQYPPKKEQKVDGNHCILCFCAKIHVKWLVKVISIPLIRPDIILERDFLFVKKIMEKH
ncbi:MAG TPA: hypothetical protein GXX65_13735, partial [Methanosarcina sp.]|nr:hypothetical protein [Methanosarcina sp.]